MPIRGVLPKRHAVRFVVLDSVHHKFWVYTLSSGSGTLYVGIKGLFESALADLAENWA